MTWILIIIAWSGSTTGHVAIEQIRGFDRDGCFEARKAVTTNSYDRAYCLWQKVEK